MKVQKSKIKISKPSKIGEYVLIGVLPTSTPAQKKEQKVVIGKNALLRSHTIIYSDVQIGEHFTTGHGVLVREKTRIGNHVSIGSGSTLQHEVKVGNYVRIHSMAFIPEYTVIHDHVWIGPGVCLTNALYPNTPSTKQKLKGPVLEEHCVIGCNATILPGVKIGRAAVVGAGSVVLKNVPSGAVVAGNPARIIGSVLKIPEYRHLWKFLRKKNKK